MYFQIQRYEDERRYVLKVIHNRIQVDDKTHEAEGKEQTVANTCTIFVHPIYRNICFEHGNRKIYDANVQ